MMPQAHIRWMAILRIFLLGVIVSRCIDSYISPLRSHLLRLHGPSISSPAYSSPPSKSDMEQARSDESRSLQSCCDEDFCFPEPPSTEAGLTIRCILTKNGLDVEWVNPEDEGSQIVDPVKLETIQESEDEDDEDEEE